MKNNITIRIYTFDRTEDGEGYDLRKAYECYRKECTPDDFLKQRNFALIKLGGFLGFDSNLAAIQDDISGTTYYHECSWSGEITQHSFTGLKKFLEEKFKMAVIGKPKWEE